MIERNAATRREASRPASSDSASGGAIRAVAPLGFGLTVRPDRERALVLPVGELDLVSAGAVEREVVGLLERGFPEVVVDLRGLSFLDSTGIRALVTCHRRARGEGARLTIILGDDRTRRPLDICGLLGELNVIDP